ncbi:hypothetical protein [Kineosporia sp. NBRC 101731]|uniref:hypothetical protein n=1 Tax=Kineosporia sp. NBRC 101731 TaxID=3032199 RepID=UPI0024A18B48|nr:hypothetical protein [Kineosporia sp. NBRC 101731]GLY28357.1 hypothetical protein Kisp02_17220 [Kineosporia sp. NBRC 101731]
MGFRIWSVWDPSQLEADFAPRIESCSQELLLTDFTDEAGLREVIVSTVERAGIDVVMHCGYGSSVRPVVEEAWRLGRSPNPPEVYERLAARSGTVRVPPEAPRVSVQAVTVNGTHHVVGMTAHRTTGPPHFRLTGYLQPAPLTDHEQKTIGEVVADELMTSGYRSGPSVTEVVLLPEGPQIVSVRPHLGVDRIPLLIEGSCGFDLEEAVFSGLQGGHPLVPDASRYAELGFFLLPEGLLETYTGMEDIAVTPWVRGVRFPYQVGDRIAPADDVRARRAYVAVVGDTPEITQERIARARQDLVAGIRPV